MHPSMQVTKWLKLITSVSKSQTIHNLESIGIPVRPGDSRITLWGCMRDLVCTPLKWWYESLCAWDNSIKESWKYKKIWAWLNDSRKAPLENQDKIKTDHQLGMYLINGDDHANQWRSTTLNQSENMPQYGNRCVVGRKIKWHQIIQYQMCTPSHPCPQLNRIQKSKRRFLEEEEAWWYLNVEKCESDWMAQERLH